MGGQQRWKANLLLDGTAASGSVSIKGGSGAVELSFLLDSGSLYGVAMRDFRFLQFVDGAVQTVRLYSATRIFSFGIVDDWASFVGALMGVIRADAMKTGDGTAITWVLGRQISGASRFAPFLRQEDYGKWEGTPSLLPYALVPDVRGFVDSALSRIKGPRPWGGRGLATQPVPTSFSAMEAQVRLMDQDEWAHNVRLRQWCVRCEDFVGMVAPPPEQEAFFTIHLCVHWVFWSVRGWSDTFAYLGLLIFREWAGEEDRFARTLRLAEGVAWRADDPQDASREAGIVAQELADDAKQRGVAPLPVGLIDAQLVRDFGRLAFVGRTPQDCALLLAFAICCGELRLFRLRLLIAAVWLLHENGWDEWSTPREQLELCLSKIPARLLVENGIKAKAAPR